MPAPTCGRIAPDPNPFLVHPADGALFQSTPQEHGLRTRATTKRAMQWEES